MSPVQRLKPKRADVAVAPAIIPARRGRRRLEEGPALSRDSLIAALLKLAQSEGIKAINMRRVAASLGVSSRLLYSHVRDKDDMLELLGAAITEQCAPPSFKGAWRERLRKIALALRESSVRYPLIPSWVLIRSAYNLKAPVTVRLAQDIHSALADAGLSDEAARQAFLAFAALTTGHIALSHGGEFSGDARLGDGAGYSFSAKDIERAFNLSLQRYLDGVQTLAGA
jgi:AcrR family transcriptional regulator